MPSFSLTNPSPSSSVGSSLVSMHRTIIAYVRALLPPSFYDFIPFILAGLMALLFTALLVLLVEDSEDAYTHTNTQDANSHSTAILHKDKKRKGRLMGLAEQDSDAAERGTDDEEWAWDPRADRSNSDHDRKISTEWTRVQKEKMALSGYRYRTTNPRLLASPPPSASPQSPAFTPPILSMAKIIMHRHDQSSKRARAASSRPSPPPSPPACTASGSGTSSGFGTMQYTLKSAAIKDTKKVMIAFPSSEEEEDSDSGVETVSPSSTPASSPSSSPLSPVFPHQSPRTVISESDTTTLSISQSPSSLTNDAPSTPQPSVTKNTTPPTRHVRSRSIAHLPSIQVPPTGQGMILPALVPALQQQQPTLSSEHVIRRRPSSMLEEGGVPAQPAESAQQARSVGQSQPSSESKKTARRARKRSGSGAAAKARVQQRLREEVPQVPQVPEVPTTATTTFFARRLPSEGLVALEEGSR